MFKNLLSKQNFDYLNEHFPLCVIPKVIISDIRTMLKIKFDKNNYYDPIQQNDSGWFVSKQK